ncbi:MAG: hypothetical protein QNK04_01550 [Myxococcota bacterium]|nr:hypothetical protein [Myxococcota bacterium]
MRRGSGCLCALLPLALVVGGSARAQVLAIERNGLGNDGAGGIAAACDAEPAASRMDGGSRFLRDPDSSPAEPFPPVPSLDATGVAVLVALLLCIGGAACVDRSRLGR